MLFFSLVFWGSAFPAIRATVNGYPPVTMAVFRFLIASATLIPLAIFQKIRLPRRQDVVWIAIAAFFSIPGYHVCLNVGEQNVTASAASLILSTLPLWVILGSSLFLNEKFHPSAWIGIILAFAGAVLIALGEGRGLELNPYVGFVFLSALCGSVYTVIQKKLIANYRPIEFNCYIIWIGTLYLLPFSSGLFDTIKAAPPMATHSVVYLGIFPGAITFVLWASVMKRLSASRAVMFLYLIPVVATLIGWFWHNELPSWLSLGGGVIILIGVVLTQLLMKRVGPDGAGELA